MNNTAVKITLIFQPYHCNFCGKSFNEHTATLAARLDTQNSREPLLSNRDEAEILREQVESLKQELCDQIQLTDKYRQKVGLTEHELALVQGELSTLLMSSVRLELAQAKELAQTIWKKRKSASNSLAELLSAIYNSTIYSEELKQIDQLSVTTKPLKRTKATTKNDNELKVPYNEAGVRDRNLNDSHHEQAGELSDTSSKPLPAFKSVSD